MSEIWAAADRALALPGLGWLLGAVVIAGLVRGFSGFGSALIIMPIASSVLAPVEAIITLTLIEFFGPLPNLPRALRDGERGDVMRLLLGAALALPLGLFVLTRLPVDVFGWTISIVVLILLVLLVLGWRYHGVLTRKIVVATGALGGFLSGAVGIPGPPVIMLYMASARKVSVIRANFILYLLGIDLLMVAAFTLLGLFSIKAAILGLMLAVPYLAANVVGALLFNPGAEKLYRTVAYVIIAASALAGLPIFG